ncbi:acyl-CoA dehydrogenase family protein [Novosphingobium sp. JCM 18896]|uniref:acyl-CoA dehydrogenase family protein n=1 Tax=Novosphingobium sp. JCM 18896 TaxID=2989731 RepID=UPI0022223507|nr:acyl-CoA dehydrogenase family protein [Novosphingobium sp. JCM 18896]MCW1428196.1 acyl-CoA dehydrogenase family protein [Novosphingobium sp. JCM 18896]
MLLSLSEDQTQILDFIDSLTRPYAAVPMHDVSFALTSDALDAELVEGGFLDVMAMEELGAVTAALVVEKLARLPFAVEAAASALVRPLLDPELPRPLCLVEEGSLRKPVRFLKPGATVVVVGEGSVRSFTAGEEHVRSAGDEVLYGYPVAFLTGVPAETRSHDVTSERLLTAWRGALAAEAAGLLAAALASVTTYVGERKQFGRPIATFQALRHRLAEIQVATNGVYWLALRAAMTGTAGDAALAALHAQEAAKRVGYDFHQFLGAMGMTLEHPLHLWTYRLKLLTAELGGRGAQAVAAADAIWGD